MTDKPVRLPARAPRSALRLIALAALLLGATGWSSSALACKCRPFEVAEAKAEAQLVFEGRVSKIADETPSEGGPPAGKLITLEIVRTWKGVDNVETITLRTNESSASCGYTFALDTSYLVYAGGTPDAYSVSSCSRTRPMAEASEDLAALGAGITPVKIDAAADAGTTSDAGVATGKPPAVRQGGCAGGKGNASSALVMMSLPAVGLVLKRRKRSS
jgi:hypothetical protein